MKVVAILMGAVLVLPAQTGSIRQNTSSAAEAARRPMGLGVDSSLRLMIEFVYAPHESRHWMPLPASQVVGGPEWMDSVRWDVVTPASLDGPQKWPMWQKLLADRFQLKLHRETREMPLYSLTPAEGGAKLPAAKAAECVSFPPGTPPRHVPGKVDCGYVAGPMQQAGEEQIRGSRVRMADLVRVLAVHLNRPIVDKTGYAAEFDLDFRYPAGEMFTALERQLGLKLTAATGPVEVIVVDHAVRP